MQGPKHSKYVPPLISWPSHLSLDTKLESLPPLVTRGQVLALYRRETATSQNFSLLLVSAASTASTQAYRKTQTHVGLLPTYKRSLCFVSPSCELFGTSAQADGRKNAMGIHSHHENSSPGFWPVSLHHSNLRHFLGKSFKFQRNKNKLGSIFQSNSYFSRIQS